MYNFVIENGVLCNPNFQDGIEDLSVLLDKKVGLICCGTEDLIKERYNEFNDAIKEWECKDIYDLFVVNFKDFDSSITLDEKCIFINYMLNRYIDGHTVFERVNGSTKDFKNWIKEL